MTEIDYLKCKLEDTEKAFDKLHKKHIELLKQQGKLEKENEQLQKQVESSETTSNATSHYNAFLESKITTLEKENDKLIQKNCIPCELVNLQTIEIDKLKEENEKLRQELNGKDCRKCGNYCRDKALDYCLVDEREPSYFSFPFKWDYKAEAEKCKYYYR